MNNENNNFSENKTNNIYQVNAQISDNNNKKNTNIKTNNLKYVNININQKNKIQFKNQFNINENEKSDKIIEFAKNLLKEDLSIQQNSIGTNETMNFYNNNKSKEETNDFSSLLMYNTNKKNKSNHDNKNLKKNSYLQEYDFDNNRGSRRIMNLNYYDSLLQ